MSALRTTRTATVALCALLLSAAPLSAQQGAGAAADSGQLRRLTLTDALRRVESANLTLRLARAELAAAEARVVSAGARPNPGLAVNREQLSDDAGDYHETVVTLGQTFEIGGQRGLRRDAARTGVSAAEARVAAASSNLAFEVRRAYVRAAAAEANLAALAEATGIFRQVESSGQSRFAEGDISRFDRSRLQVERLRYENLLAGAQLALDEQGRELAMLVATDSLAIPGYRLLPAEGLASLAAPGVGVDLAAALAGAAERADVRAAAAEIDAARARVTLQGRERIPDLTVSAGYKEQAGGVQGGVVGVSIPLPLLDRNRGPIAEARAALDAAVLRRDLAQRQAESEVRRAWETYRSLEERVRLISRTILPESGGLLETASVSYAEGEMSLLELLDAADAHRTAREAVNQMLADYLISIYELERAAGRALAPAATPSR